MHKQRLLQPELGSYVAPFALRGRHLNGRSRIYTKVQHALGRCWDHSRVLFLGISVCGDARSLPAGAALIKQAMARVASAALLTAVFAPAIGNRLFVLAGCTTNSFTTPSWLVENYASQTLGNSTVAAFQALNRATNTSLQLRCQASSNATAPGGWQSCSAQNRTNSDLPFVAAFQASNYTAYFFFNETWACSDVPGKPYVC
jgi:hypothetical protein